MLKAKLYLPADEKGREAERLAVGVHATLRDASAAPFDVVVVDLSTTGLRVSYAGVLEVGDRVRIGISGVGVRSATVVHADADYGCSFDQPIDPDHVATIPGANTVLQADFGAVASPNIGEPAIERWPGWVRVAILAGLVTSMWGGIFMIAR